MGKDTVLLSIEKYNELRDFKKEVEKNRNELKFAVIEETWNSSLGSGYSKNIIQKVK